MKKNLKVLIICPALNNLGGTELETIITSQVFLEKKLAKKITIFSPSKVSKLVRGFSTNNGIIFQNYPKYLKSKIFLKFDYHLKKFFKIFHKDYSPTEYLFWFFKNIYCKYHFIYVITDSAQFYYAPIIANFNLKKVIVKLTTCFDYTNWKKSQKSMLEKCSVILVTATTQKIFLQSKFQIKNVAVVDVFIWNEKKLNEILVKKTEKFVFGMLCRISKEKKIEDAIKLMSSLRDSGQSLSLTIKGPSIDKDYLEFLFNLIKKLNIEDIIEMDIIPVLPTQIPEFYYQINGFLITSDFEGGPNTGIECLAAGIPVLSYDIGAMSERLEPFKELLIAKDYESLIRKAIHLLSLDNDNYQKLSLKLKKHYKNYYTNELKLKKTIIFLS